MNFASLPYLLFLVTVVAIYFSIGKQFKSLFLLLASYFFYSIFGFGFAALMLITSIVTYYFSSLSYESTDQKKRKLFFYLGLIIDLLFFILFKYIHVIDIDIMNWPNFTVQKVLIPIGISFYTFKTVGYCIDIYKRKYEPIKSFTEYALSVSFFPQLIAGPIEKSKTICLQLNHSAYHKENIIEGAKLILWGLFKKIVIADSIAQIINPIFNNITNYSGLDYTIVFLSFSYQLYTDFSGYSDIAIGSAKCFGVDLPANFNKPYFAKNYREFWIRWHISFSKWLKEYIFEPLGGVVKNNKLRTCLNLFILFIIVGFWHGATPNFIIYAQLAFLLILIDIITKDYRKKILKKMGISFNGIILKLINYSMMVSLIAFLSIFFKIPHTSESIYILKHCFPLQLSHLSKFNIILLLGYVVLFELFQSSQLTATGHCFEKVKSFSIRLMMYLIMIFSILLLSSRVDLTFQYFQF